MRTGCPSQEELARWATGQLSADDDARLRRHAAGCATCRPRLDDAGGARTPALASSATLPASATPVSGPPPRAPQLAKGTLVGRYVVIDFIGAGGMGAVYSAFDPGLGRRVAIKLLRGDDLDFARSDLLLREAQVLARFSHPHVATIHDTGTFAGQVFLAMEFVDGGTLRDWLDAGPRSWRDVVALFAAAGEGLAAAHRAGLVHRDFKPENVLIGRDGRARVSDFGLAGPSGSGAGEVSGTPSYMAPEQLAGQASDARADLFSFCVALYEGLFGLRPFIGESLAALSDAIRAGVVREPPRDRRVPAWLRQLVLSGLRTDPALRPASMDLLLAGLRADPERRRRRLLAAAGLAIVAAGGGVLVEHTRAARTASCAGAATLLGGAWDAGRREEVRAAFARTGLPYAAASFAGAAQLLDAYAQQWTAMRSDACEATRVRRTQPEETMALRVACLDDRRRELGALADVLRAADHDIVDHAAGAASGLTPLAGCADVTALAAPLPRPRDPARKARLEAALAHIAEGHALMIATKNERALTVAQSALAETRAVAHAPSEAAAGTLLSNIEMRGGQLDKAMAHAEAALYDAQRGHDDQQVIYALELLTQEVGCFAGRAEEGLRYAALALATIERTGNDPIEIVDFKSVRSLVLAAAGRLDEAFADKRDVVAAWEKRLGANNISTIEARSNLGIVLTAEGRLVEAQAQFSQALQALERVVGAGNPETLPAKNNLGSALLLLGRTAEAAPILEAGPEESRRAFGEQSQYFALSLVNLGELRNAQRRFADARPLLARAIALFEGFGPDNAGLCEPLTQLGLALVGMGRTTEALAPLERALAIGKARGIAATDLARVQLGLARGLVAAHRDPVRARALIAAGRQNLLDAARRWGGENARFADELAAGLEP